MDTVNNYVLYLATVSIKHKSTDQIKAGTTFSMALTAKCGLRDIIQTKKSAISVICRTIFWPQFLIVR